MFETCWELFLKLWTRRLSSPRKSVGHNTYTAFSLFFKESQSWLLNNFLARWTNTECTAKRMLYSPVQYTLRASKVFFFQGIYIKTYQKVEVTSARQHRIAKKIFTPIVFWIWFSTLKICHSQAIFAVLVHLRSSVHHQCSSPAIPIPSKIEFGHHAISCLLLSVSYVLHVWQ